MTYDQFLTELNELNVPWHVADYDREHGEGELRCERGDCPITAVARAHGYNYSTNAWDFASRDLGLEDTIAGDIVTAQATMKKLAEYSYLKD